MQITRLAMPEVLLTEPKVFGDARGFFYKSFSQRTFDEATGTPTAFVQDDHSRSRKGVLRGLYYRLQQLQGKLLGAARGAAFHPAVDIRKDSLTFGRGAQLSENSPPPAVGPVWADPRLCGVERNRRLSVQNHRLLRVRP